MIAGIIAWFAGSRVGRWVAATGTIAVILTIAVRYLVGIGEAKQRVREMEAQNDARKRMADEAARAPADRDELVDRLRKGEF